MSIQCPRTKHPLRPVTFGKVTVDFCDGCGGVFFDRFELERFDDDVEFAGQELAELMEQYQNTLVDTGPRVRCPKHLDAVMMRHYYSPKKGVIIDECPACGGIWMDAGELAEAREEQPNQAARQATTDAFVREVLSNPEMAKYNAELNTVKAKADNVKAMLSGLVNLPVRRI